MRALIAYTSLEGQTEMIARHLSQQLKANGVPADTYNIANNSGDKIAVESYDAVLVGSSLHYAEYDLRVKLYIRDNLRALQKLPTGFFSVSLGINSKHLYDREEVIRLTEGFLAEVRFEPDLTAYFAGALKYSKYGWIKKRVMRWIANESGENDKDYATDHEYTDWGKVDEFARDFATGLKVAPDETGDANTKRKRTLIRAASVYAST